MDNPLLSILGGIGDVLSFPGSVVRGGLRSALSGFQEPFQLTSGRELLGLDDSLGGHIGGFAADVATDPLTWAGGALLRALRGGKAAGPLPVMGPQSALGSADDIATIVTKGSGGLPMNIKPGLHMPSAAEGGTIDLGKMIAGDPELAAAMNQYRANMAAAPHGGFGSPSMLPKELPPTTTALRAEREAAARAAASAEPSAAEIDKFLADVANRTPIEPTLAKADEAMARARAAMESNVPQVAAITTRTGGSSPTMRATTSLSAPGELPVGISPPNTDPMRFMRTIQDPMPFNVPPALMAEEVVTQAELRALAEKAAHEARMLPRQAIPGQMTAAPRAGGDVQYYNNVFGGDQFPSSKWNVYPTPNSAFRAAYGPGGEGATYTGEWLRKMLAPLMTGGGGMAASAPLLMALMSGGQGG